jgi:coproporphyrinogen III oxidase-like Fe-S oxidoreductase
LIDEYAVNYDEYAGLGSGAIGHLGGSAYANTFDIEAYVEEVNKGMLPVAAKRDFSLQDRVRYDFLMKLFGLSLDVTVINAKHGVNIYRHLWPEILFFWLVRGLKKQGDILTLTERGQYYWFIMMREFFVSVNNFRDYCRAQINVKGPARNKEMPQ